MSSIISLILTSLLLLPAGVGSGDGDGDKKKKGQDQYYKYEREDVNLYRDRSDFIMPEPQTVIPEAKENEYVQPVSLKYLFQGGNKVYIDSDYRLNQLIAVHKEINRKITHVDGFRIQLYAGRGESGARRYFARSMNLFPDQQAYFEFASPNYIVRVGDFMDKEEALLFTRKIREYFPDAFLVPAKVKVPKYHPDEEDDE